MGRTLSHQDSQQQVYGGVRFATGPSLVSADVTYPVQRGNTSQRGSSACNAQTLRKEEQVEFLHSGDNGDKREVAAPPPIKQFPPSLCTLAGELNRDEPQGRQVHDYACADREI